MTARDKKIRQIESYLQEFDLELFRACLGNLKDADNPLRVNNFSYSLREVIRHIFERLSPDSEVRNCAWWQHERYRTEEQKSVPIEKVEVFRSEKMRYSIQYGLADNVVEEKLFIDVRDEVRTLRDADAILNKFTHIQPKTFNLKKAEQEELIEIVLQALLDFLSLFDQFRKQLLTKLEVALNDAVRREALNSTIDALEEISSGYMLDDLQIEDSQISSIGSHQVEVNVSGTAFPTLQLGSQKDGVTLDEEFPFSATVTFACNGLKVDSVSNLKINNESWFQ